MLKEYLMQKGINIIIKKDHLRTFVKIKIGMKNKAQVWNSQLAHYSRSHYESSYNNTILTYVITDN